MADCSNKEERGITPSIGMRFGQIKTFYRALLESIFGTSALDLLLCYSMGFLGSHLNAREGSDKGTLSHLFSILSADADIL